MQEITWAMKSLCWPKCTVTSASTGRLLIQLNRLIVLSGGDRLLVSLISHQTWNEFGDRLLLHDCW